MTTYPIPPTNTRLGFHYFPDTRHYRQSDLRRWLPELRSLGASWLTLLGPADRAIPEHFLRGLIEAGIEPVIHVPLSLASFPPAREFWSIFTTYVQWGVHYVVLFDRPNNRIAWPPAEWAQNELVERFLDSYLPLAELAVQAGLFPVFPPLEPGGDYWDTAFLRAALESILRRNRRDVLDRLVLGAYAWAGERPLSWGAGGPDRWPGARPYYTPQGEQDHRGFHIFDWYLPIAQAVAGKDFPLILFKAGSRPGEFARPQSGIKDPVAHQLRDLAIAKAIVAPSHSGSLDEVDKATIDPIGEIPESVLACNFWLLSASPESPHHTQAWIKPDGSAIPIAETFHHWMARRGQVTSSRPQSPNPKKVHTPTRLHPISHYLLLPVYEWGVADFYLDAIRPFIKKYRLTVGFSPTEAARAARVTVLGDAKDYPPGTFSTLRQAGCQVEYINRDGTSPATYYRDHPGDAEFQPFDGLSPDSLITEEALQAQLQGN